MKNNVLQVRMLGGFSMVFQGVEVIGNETAKNKVLYLLEYLLLNHDRAVPQKELIDVILEDKECTDPVNVLKNLIYRARKLLEQSQVLDKSVIYCRKNNYGISEGINISLDVDNFEGLVHSSKEAKDETKKLSLTLQALELYKGEFLPFSYQQNWVIPLIVKYQNFFYHAMEIVCDILLKQEDYERILSVTEKATALYPYGESFYIARITALYQMGKLKNAIQEFEAISAKLFDDLGVTPSQELQEIYLKATCGTGRNFDSAITALEDIMGDNGFYGAFYCNYYMFSNICRFAVRHNKRNGDIAFLILCSISQKDNATIDIDSLKPTVETFHKSVDECLRQNDIYTRCAPGQFLILLMGANQENSHMVMRRMENTFKRNVRGKNVKLHFQYVSHTDLKRINGYCE